MPRKPKESLPCPFPDCFSCPHPDCIKNHIGDPGKNRRMTDLSGLTPEEKKAHHAAVKKAWKERNPERVREYCARNREKRNRQQRERYHAKKEREAAHE